MSQLPDFKARVQFSFNRETGEKLDGEAAILYNKVAELFHTKRAFGGLNYWLLELAYEAARKELGMTSTSGQPKALGARQKARVPEQPESEMLGVEQQGESEAPKQPQMEQVAQKGGAKELEPDAVLTDDMELDDGLDGGSVSGFDNYIPATLSEVDKEKSSKRTMPKGISGLVLSPL